MMLKKRFLKDRRIASSFFAKSEARKKLMRIVRTCIILLRMVHSNMYIRVCMYTACFVTKCKGTCGAIG